MTLLESVLTGRQRPGEGSRSSWTTCDVADRFGMWGRTLQENELRLCQAADALASRGITIPRALDTLLAGYARHPASW